MPDGLDIVLLLAGAFLAGIVTGLTGFGTALTAMAWGGMDFALITMVGFLLASFSTPFQPAREIPAGEIVLEKSILR